MKVFIITALSADGFLADKQKAGEKSTAWTSKEDRQFFVTRTKQAGVCVMGANTYATIGHPLAGRLTIVYTTHPEKFPDIAPFTPEILSLPKDTPGVYWTNLPPDQLIDQLTGITDEVAICGGSSIYTLFMQAGVVDTLYLTLEPILFGDGIPLFSAPLTQKLELVSTSPLNSQTLLLEYHVPKPYKDPMV